MTNQEIFELMARFDASTATTLKLSTKDFSLELGKGGPGRSHSCRRPGSRPRGRCVAGGCSSACGQVHHRPLGWTFYAASAPDAAPFWCRWATM